jgi:hypothetical protein
MLFKKVGTIRITPFILIKSSENKIYLSSDGDTWNSVYTAEFPLGSMCIGYSGDIPIANVVCYSGQPQYLTTSDMNTWTISSGQPWMNPSDYYIDDLTADVLSYTYKTISAVDEFHHKMYWINELSMYAAVCQFKDNDTYYSKLYTSVDNINWTYAFGVTGFSSELIPIWLEMYDRLQVPEVMYYDGYTWNSCVTQIRYNTNTATDGTAPVDTESYEYNDDIPISANTGNLVKAGCTFTGWNSCADHHNFYAEHREPEDTFQLITPPDEILYAEWEVLPGDDWYMPSKDELNQMYINLYLEGVGEFQDAKYYSSSEVNGGVAWLQDFGNADTYSLDWTKPDEMYIRPIRSFVSTTSYSLRDIGPAGGWIFYIDGTTYYEASQPIPDDTEPELYMQWTPWPAYIAGTNTAIGTGQANTTAIITNEGHTVSAAKVCSDLDTREGI